MKIRVFSDIHGDIAALTRAMEPEADYYFAAGDLVNWGKGLDRVGEVLRAKADRVYVIPGNHESPAMISDFCARFGLHDFHGKWMAIGGVHLAGLGCSSPTPFDTPGEYPEDEFERRLAPFAGRKPLVMVCHCPPQGTLLDKAGAGRHFGSTAMYDFIQREQPAYFFCGHVHEAWGVREVLGATLGVNVGKAGFELDLSEVK
jgi:Icc-related predicted phosphoesterase